MTDQVDQAEGQDADSGQQAERVYTEIEQRAMDQGWVPKDDFNGDVSMFIDAPEFVRRGELFAKIDAQNKELKQTKKAITELVNQSKRIAQASYEQARKELLAEKKEALREGDVDRVVEIEEQIEQAKEVQRAAEASALDEARAAVQEMNPVFTEWTQKNTWYGKDEDLTDWADARGQRLAKQGMSPDEVLSRISKEAKEKFPNKFNNPNRARAGAVESGRGAPGAGGSNNLSDGLTAQEKQIMRTVVATGAISEADYIKQLKALKG